MRRNALWLPVLLLLISPAHAAWKIGSVKDPMTDRKLVFATAPAKSPSQGISATLHLSCNPQIGVVPVSALLSERFTRGAVKIVFRVDDKPVHASLSRVGSTGHDVFIMSFNGEFLRRAHRFRLQLDRAGDNALFFDFDVTGADTAMKAINCRRPHG